MTRDLKTILNEILDIGGTATELNLASPCAQTSEGAVLQVSRRIKEALKYDLIRALPNDRPIPKDERRKKQFYALTGKGARVAERAEEYKYKKPRAVSEIEHESGIKDIALSIKRTWPDAVLSFEKPLKDIVNAKSGWCDIYAEVGTLKLIIEYERKIEANRVYRDKILKYSQFSYPPNMRVCIIFNTLSANPYLRSQTLKEFEREELEKKHFGNYLYYRELTEKRLFKNLTSADQIKIRTSVKWYEESERIKEMQHKFSNLMEKMKAHEQDRFFRLTTWNNYYKLDEPVWFLPDGNKVKLFN
jgi:hypothetical protein